MRLYEMLRKHEGEGNTVAEVEQYFGPGFLFEKNEKEMSGTRLNALSSGKRTNTGKRFRGNRIVLFENEQYPIVVRITYDVPTFDEGDRMYDSWRDIFLARDRLGELYGMYAAGGYETTAMRWLGRVRAYPEELKSFLHDIVGGK